MDTSKISDFRISWKAYEISGFLGRRMRFQGGCGPLAVILYKISFMEYVVVLHVATYNTTVKLYIPKYLYCKIKMNINENQSHSYNQC